ncbi:FAD-dependent monooxygenase [Chitinophaga sp.]|uniref:FAD-dependent monooxygenase n=1 Tax=Chitinophaga sp. TaxID=1869181 RepID=UPI0031D3EBD8
MKKEILISGASIAGLATAFWMNKAGYKVTVVEIAHAPRMGGTAVDLQGPTIDVVKRMGIYEQLKLSALNLERIEFKNAADETDGFIAVEREGEEIEIERTELVRILLDQLKDEVNFIFNNSITALNETVDNIAVTFKDGSSRPFELVIGCDGTHSGVRGIWFGPENKYAHFLGAYFSISIIDKLLIKQNTMQFYNVPGKAYMLNAYRHKTDIVFCFLSEKEIPYDYRNVEEQRKIILEQFGGQGWRTTELLKEVAGSENFYFDKFCQIKMPCWTKGRVALVGDAAYCASPAAGRGGSLAMDGAAALADALEKHNGNFESAFRDYNKNLRPLIEEVQADAAYNVKEKFVLATEEAIRQRNQAGF